MCMRLRSYAKGLTLQSPASRSARRVQCRATIESPLGFHNGQWQTDVGTKLRHQLPAPRIVSGWFRRLMRKYGMEFDERYVWD
jgi:hypothetical protein